MNFFKLWAYQCHNGEFVALLYERHEIERFQKKWGYGP